MRLRDGAMDLLNRIFCPDMARRISVQELIAHPWLAGPTPSLDGLGAELMRRHQQVQLAKAAELEARRERRRLARATEEEKVAREVVAVAAAAAESEFYDPAQDLQVRERSER